jgi:collagenase-like PrtC family protease
MGLDALLKPAQDRAASREAMIKQIQADRQPLWITALQNAGNKPGNIAQVLNQMATGTSAAKQGYNTQDLKFLDELNDLYANIDKAKIEGRYKDVAAVETAIKDLIADKRQAEQSGTSLLTNKETARSREQIAKEGRLSREQTAALAAQGREDARTEKMDAAYREQAMKLAMAAAMKEKQLPANMVKYKDVSAEQLAATMYDRIYNALKSGKMGTAPSAESPSGTSKPGWGIKPLG